MRENSSVDTSKVFKISYEINTLPIMGEHIKMNKETGEREFVKEGVYLMQLFKEATELEIFSTETVIDLLEFKWVEYGKNFHLFGCVMHFMYMTLLFVYIDQIYVNFNLSLQIYF